MYEIVRRIMIMIKKKTKNIKVEIERSNIRLKKVKEKVFKKTSFLVSC